MKALQPLVIDRMVSSEADAVSQLFAEIVLALPYYNDTAKKSELSQYTAASLRESIVDDPDSVLVARVGERPIGFCISRPDDGLVWLSWFGVDATYRRQGVGAALLERLESTVREGRSHKIWCDCRTSNEASQIVLSQNNYTKICVVNNHWYGQDFILWEKLV